MYTVFKVAGILLVAFAALIVTLLGWAAFKGLLTSRGLILDLPMRGRVLPVSIETLIIVVLSIVILGVALLVVGKRLPRKDGAIQNQPQQNHVS